MDCSVPYLQSEAVRYCGHILVLWTKFQKSGAEKCIPRLALQLLGRRKPVTPVLAADGDGHVTGRELLTGASWASSSSSSDELSPWLRRTRRDDDDICWLRAPAAVPSKQRRLIIATSPQWRHTDHVTTGSTARSLSSAARTRLQSDKNEAFNGNDVSVSVFNGHWKWVSIFQRQTLVLLADRTIGRAFVTGCRLSVVCDVLYPGKTAGPICMKFSGKVWTDHGTTWLHFGSILRNRAMPRY